MHYPIVCLIAEISRAAVHGSPSCGNPAPTNLLFTDRSQNGILELKGGPDMARTKEFDEDAVLLRAMRLFWEMGYEKTSMQDLVACMGVHKRSMYDTFGDKRSLYIKALKRYSETVEARIVRRMKEAATAKEAVRLVFEIVLQQEEEAPPGCFMVNTAVELALHYFENLLQELIAKGQQAGELSRDLDPAALSSYLQNSLTGLRVLVKTTDDREKLNRIIDTTLSILA
jgi:TetR/AcrR family transcriptional regulator, transcriptional repressor for nem operon